MSAPPESAEIAFRTSAYSFKALAEALVPLMDGGGSLVGMDFDATKAWPIYDWMGVAKAALESVSRYLARDLGEQNVRVNLISAGPVETPAAQGIPGFETLAGLWEKQAPLGWDTSDPAPVADAVLFLLSDLAARRSRARSSTWTAASTRWARRSPGIVGKRTIPHRRSALHARSSSRARNSRVLLAIDVGNTQTHVGMFQDDELVEHWRFATVRFATADELATVLAGLLDLRDLRLADVHAAMVSAVVPTLAHEYEQAIERYFGGRGLLVSSDIKSGMPIRIDRPQELGADRLVNAVAAYDRVGGACIAVDFGTAINYDVVSAAGRVPRRRDLARHRDLARGPGRPRGPAAAGGHRGAAPRDREGHGGGHPGGRRLRVRRPGGRHPRPHPGGARRGGHRDRHRRLRGRDRPVLRAGGRGGRPAHAAGSEADLGAELS